MRGANGTLAEIETQLLALDPPILLLETAVPPGVTTDPGSRLSLSATHAKLGDHSLQWDHGPHAQLRVEGDLKYVPTDYEPGLDQSLMGVVPMFSMWVYNEKPIDASLLVEFGRGERTDCRFSFRLDFRGWRTCWVRYGYDTSGTPAPGMDRITFTAPPRSGRLWIDQLVKNTPMRPDNATPDFQAPEIQPTIRSNDNYHWLGLADYWRQLSDPGFATAPATPAEIEASETVRSRLLDRLRGENPVAEADVDALETRLAELDIPQLADPDATGAAIVPAGPGSLVDGFQIAVLPRDLVASLTATAAIVPMLSVCDMTLAVARAWDSATAAGDTATAGRTADMYLRLTAHLLDQGWALGSAQGTIHHIGYQYLGWASSLLLAEPLLRERRIWEPARDAVAWYCGAGRITNDFSELKDLCGVVDVLNTFSEGMLVSCLAAETTQERVARLRAFGTWLNGAHRLTPGILDGHKPDGFCFHHIGPYPAYGRDSLVGSIPVIGDLTGTPFELAPAGAAILRQAMVTMNNVSATLEWPIGLCGRHPRGDQGIHALVDAYALLGRNPLAGHDDGKGIDAEMASIFRGLVGESATTWQRGMDTHFADSGVEAAPPPQGHWQHGYAAFGAHRHHQWMASVKGLNRYLWSAEIYEGANAYGRYLSYGQIEVQSVADDRGLVTHEAGGWHQPGYDWNHIPGTTTIVLPFEELKADLTGTIQQSLLTDSPVGGAGILTGRATLFGMHLREHPTFNPTHRARISVLMVGDHILALGSDIHNDDPEHPTHTTLFQLTPETMSAPHPLTTGSNWAIDPAGNGYVVSHGSMTARTAPQTGPDQDGTSPEQTRDFTLGWIDHGTRPTDGGYEYALLVGAGAAATEAFATAMAGEEKPWVVTQRDTVAHVLYDRASGVSAHVVFEADEDLVEGSCIRRANRPCLVLLHGAGGIVSVSITDPDLHLYEGMDPDQHDDSGNHTGRYSSYSRPWRTTPSPPTRISVVLRGAWTIPQGSCDDGAPALAIDGDDTVVTVTTQHAASVEFQLERTGLQHIPTRGEAAVEPSSPIPDGGASSTIPVVIRPES